jgi:hypothetical protein
MNDPLLHFVVAMSLCLLFASAAVYKIRQSARFEAQLAAYEIVPKKLTIAIARLLAWTETAIALAMLLPQTRTWAGIAAAAMLLTYGLAMAINMLRGRVSIDCGCGDIPVLLSPWLIVRNASLAAGALVLLLPTTDRAFSWTDFVLAALCLPALAFAYRAVEQLMANASVLHEWSTPRD